MDGWTYGWTAVDVLPTKNRHVWRCFYFPIVGLMRLFSKDGYILEILDSLK